MTPADRVVACFVGLLLVLMMAGTRHVFKRSPMTGMSHASQSTGSAEYPHMP